MSLRRSAAAPLFICLLSLIFVCLVWAEGTQLWKQSTAAEFEKGTSHGIAIRSDGMLELAPAAKIVATTASTYVWGVASDAQGNAYLAAGSPARVYRVGADGKSILIFQSRELEAQAIATDGKGNVFVGTSPDGRIYKIPNAASVVEGGGTALSFFEPKTKYIWALAFDGAGNLYAGTGDDGEIYRVDASGKGGVFFKSDETHIRALAFDGQGNLIAGSDGSGLVYRITPQGNAFALFSAPKKEITALAIDAAGDIYAASLGDKHNAASTEQAPGPSEPGARTAKAETEAAKATTTGGGSEIDELTPDGASRNVWNSREDMVYAMAFDRSGRLLIGTGNRGIIFALSGDAPAGSYENLLKLSASQVMAFAPARDGMFAVTSNLGKLVNIGGKLPAEGTFESDVFDARTLARWGRVEVHGRGKYEIALRSGNVDNPDRNWSNWTRVDLHSDNPPDVPAARFAQWRAVLHSGDMIDSVTVNYHPRNIAPVVDEITVNTAVRTNGAAGREIKVTWNAHDDNEDQLRYSVYFRGEGETRWKLLRQGLRDKQTILDPTMFPDGEYRIRVVASDEPSHSPEDALTGERVSGSFEVDSTPPRIDALQAVPDNDTLHISFRASDSYAPIKRAEFSIDAGDWQVIEPVGGLSDARTETYDFNALTPAAPPDASAAAIATQQRRGRRRKQPNPQIAPPPPQEHLVVVRVFNRFDNVATAKTVVNGEDRAAQ